MQGVVVN